MVEFSDGVRLFGFGTDEFKAADDAAQYTGGSRSAKIVERCEDVDCYAPGPVNLRELILLKDYAFYCSECNCTVDEDLYDYKTARELTPVYLDAQQAVFCSTKCQAKYLRAQQLKLH